MKLVPWFAFLVFVLNACAKEKVVDEYETTIVPGSLVIPDSLYEDQLGYICFTAIGSNSCARYARYESIPKGNCTSFRIYCNSIEGICLTAQTHIDTSIVYSFSRPGWNYISFDTRSGIPDVDSVFVIEN